MAMNIQVKVFCAMPCCGVVEYQCWR